MNARYRGDCRGDAFPASRLLSRFVHGLSSENLKGAFKQIDAYWVEGGPIHLPTPGSEQALGASGIVLVEVVERNLTSLKINVDAFREVFRLPSGTS